MMASLERLPTFTNHDDVFHVVVESPSSQRIENLRILALKHGGSYEEVLEFISNGLRQRHGGFQSATGNDNAVTIEPHRNRSGRRHLQP